MRSKDLIVAGQKKGGFGILRYDVLWHEPSQTNLLVVSLNKSEALFSPSNRYRDLALGPSLFHWESQEGEERPMAIRWRLERASPAAGLPVLVVAPGQPLPAGPYQASSCRSATWAKA